MALLHRRLVDGARLERGQRLGALTVERDLDDRGQPVAHRVAAKAGRRGVRSRRRRPALTRRRHVAGEVWTRAASAWLVSEASLCSTSRILSVDGVELHAQFASSVLKEYFVLTEDNEDNFNHDLMILHANPGDSAG